MYLNPSKSIFGAYPALQTEFAPGLVSFPDEFVPVFYQKDKRFSGFVNVIISDGAVTDCSWDETSYQAYASEHPESNPTPAELREEAYNTQAIIEWNGEMITVTQAAQLWQYYAAEGSTEKTEELTSLIASAKQSIREQYPDE